MKVTLDSHTIDIPCPHCAHKISQTIGQLKTQDTITCSRCGTVSNLDKAHMRGEIAKLQREVDTQVNKAAADLKRTLGRLGKR